MAGEIKSLNIQIFIFYSWQRTDFKTDSEKLFDFGGKEKTKKIIHAIYLKICFLWNHLQ